MFSVFFKVAVSHDPNIGSREIKYVNNDFLFYYAWKPILNFIFDVQASCLETQKQEQCVVRGQELLVNTPPSGIVLFKCTRNILV